MVRRNRRRTGVQEIIPIWYVPAAGRTSPCLLASYPDAQTDAGIIFSHFINVGKTAERGLFDRMFSSDTPTLFTAYEVDLERSHFVSWIEPFSLLAAPTPDRANVDLVCTASTSF